MLNAEDNERLTRTGPGTPMGEVFRRFWMPALLGEELPAPDCPPRRVNLLGEAFVAFRDSQNRVGIMDARCPHRGASLFYGRNEQAGLRCAYHGWKFDIEGNCLDMPTVEPGPGYATQCAGVRLRALPVHEAGGIIWAYMGPGEAPPFPHIAFTQVPAAHRFVSKKLQECNWAQACEGGLDTAHFSYLHMSVESEHASASAAMGQSALVASGNPNLLRWCRDDGRPKFSVIEHDAGFVIGGARRADGDELYWRISQFLAPNHGLTPAAFPGENSHGQTWVPIDDHSCWIYCWSWNLDRPITDTERQKFRGSHAVHAEVDANYIPLRNRGNDYLLDREDQKHRTYIGVRGISEQDACIQDSQGFIADRSIEHLGPTDIGIVRFRRLMLRLARELAGGTSPAMANKPAAYFVSSGSAIAPANLSLEDVMLRRFGNRLGHAGATLEKTP